MKIGGVACVEALGHSHQLFLAVCQVVKPFGWEIIVGVNLKHAHAFAIVAEQCVAIGSARVRAAGMPCLTIENDDAARGRFGLCDMLDGHVLGRRRQSAFVRAGYDARAAICRREIVEHPNRIHHHRRIGVQHFLWDVAVQPLVWIARAHDAGIQAAENERFTEIMFQQREDPRMVDGLVKHAIQGRQIGDVACGSAIRGLRTDFPLAAEIGRAHV